jgi:hypothetical protein
MSALLHYCDCSTCKGLVLRSRQSISQHQTADRNIPLSATDSGIQFGAITPEMIAEAERHDSAFRVRFDSPSAGHHVSHGPIDDDHETSESPPDFHADFVRSLGVHSPLTFQGVVINVGGVEELTGDVPPEVISALLPRWIDGSYFLGACVKGVQSCMCVDDWYRSSRNVRDGNKGLL